LLCEKVGFVKMIIKMRGERGDRESGESQEE
jgi:hypothetical protein